MTWWHALVLGVVEGLTEFLPVSSTGHLILASHFLGLEQTEFMKTFQISIQLGAVGAVLLVYGRSFLTDAQIWKRVLASFVPTALAGLFLYKTIKTVFLSSEPIVLWSLFLGGVVLVLFDRWHREGPTAINDIKKIPYPTAVLVGIVQILSFVPGVSRAGATIIGGLASGFSRRTIVEFSFLLAVPTMLTAVSLELYRSGASFAQADWDLLLLGSAVSFLVALGAIRFFLRYIQRHSLMVFGLYRMAVAAVFWIFIK